MATALAERDTKQAEYLAEHAEKSPLTIARSDTETRELNPRLNRFQERQGSVAFRKSRDPIRTPEDPQKSGRMLEDDPKTVLRSEEEDQTQPSAEERHRNNMILQAIESTFHPPPRDTSSTHGHPSSGRLIPPENRDSHLVDGGFKKTLNLDTQSKFVQEAIDNKSEKVPLLTPLEPDYSLRLWVTRIINRITRPRVAPNQRRITWFCVSSLSPFRALIYILSLLETRLAIST